MYPISVINIFLNFSGGAVCDYATVFSCLLHALNVLVWLRQSPAAFAECEQLPENVYTHFSESSCLKTTIKIWQTNLLCCIIPCHVWWYFRSNLQSDCGHVVVHDASALSRALHKVLHQSGHTETSVVWIHWLTGWLEAAGLEALSWFSRFVLGRQRGLWWHTCYQNTESV